MILTYTCHFDSFSGGASNSKSPGNPGSGSGSEAFAALVDVATKANPLTKGELSGYVVWEWGASNSKSPGNPGSGYGSEAFAALVDGATMANPLTKGELSSGMGVGC